MKIEVTQSCCIPSRTECRNTRPVVERIEVALGKVQPFTNDGQVLWQMIWRLVGRLEASASGESCAHLEYLAMTAESLTAPFAFDLPIPE